MTKSDRENTAIAKAAAGGITATKAGAAVFAICAANPFVVAGVGLALLGVAGISALCSKK